MSRKTTVIGTFLIVIGIALVLMAAFLDQVSVHILLIFPVVVMSGPFGVVSVLCIFIGSVMVLLGWSRTIAGTRRKKELGRSDRSKTQQDGMEGTNGTLRGGGVLFLGPIPLILWGKGSQSGLPLWWVLLILGMIIFFLIISINILIIITSGS